jgi:hypothetical protein
VPYRLDPDNPRCIQRRPYTGDAAWETLKCYSSVEAAEQHLETLNSAIQRAEARILDTSPNMTGTASPGSGVNVYLSFKSPPEQEEVVPVAKLDEDENLVFGWFNVSVTKDGRELIDLHGDKIEASDLEKAAYNFVLESREGGEMHQGDTTAELVESFFVTPEKLESMGLPSDIIPPRWWGGFRVAPETFAKVKDGTYSMFSVQGQAQRVEDAVST